MIIDESAKKRIEAALSAENLLKLVEELEAEGKGQKEIEEFFINFLLLIQKKGNRDKDEDALMEILDAIVGWCHPARCLFPPEKYQSYPGIVRFFAAPEDQRQIVQFIFEKTSFRVFSAWSCENDDLEIKSVEEIDFTKAVRIYIWSEIISPEFSIHENYSEHLQKTCYSFISDPNFRIFFGEIKGQALTISSVSYAFRRSPTPEALQSIEPIRAYIDELQTATAIGVPVLKKASILASQGYSLKEGFETRWNYKLDTV